MRFLPDATLFISTRQLTQGSTAVAVDYQWIIKIKPVLKVPAANCTLLISLSQSAARYWQEPQKEETGENKVNTNGKDEEGTKQAPQRQKKKTPKAKKRKHEEVLSDGKKVISGVRCLFVTDFNDAGNTFSE